MSAGLMLQHRAAILLVDDHVVDDDQRLCVGVERVDALDEHGTAHARHAATGERVCLSAQLLLHLFLDVRGIGILEVGSHTVIADIVLLGIIGSKRGGIELDVALLLIGNEADSGWVVVRRHHIERTGEDGYLHFECTVVIGECAVAFHTIGGDNAAADGLVGGGIEHTAFHQARLILLLLLLDGSHGIGLAFARFFVVILSRGRYGYQQTHGN